MPLDAASWALASAGPSAPAAFAPSSAPPSAATDFVSAPRPAPPRRSTIMFTQILVLSLSVFSFMNLSRRSSHFAVAMFIGPSSSSACLLLRSPTSCISSRFAASSSRVRVRARSLASFSLPCSRTSATFLGPSSTRSMASCMSRRFMCSISFSNSTSRRLRSAKRYCSRTDSATCASFFSAAFLRRRSCSLSRLGSRFRRSIQSSRSASSDSWLSMTRRMLPSSCSCSSRSSSTAARILPAPCLHESRAATASRHRLSVAHSSTSVRPTRSLSSATSLRSTSMSRLSLPCICVRVCVTISSALSASRTSSKRASTSVLLSITSLSSLYMWSLNSFCFSSSERMPSRWASSASRASATLRLEL
mmetsp:Transcript_26474/g.90503  ORF Transcript_26474/g.90503 Transcript_26474/m.90503 type:complete len:363 (+) Transcript_26474:149-1237(+)